ncbi:hypothetical protein GH714_035164 [Hevea brasiliensis]|uniref:Protein argonaute N-terminal domain-containing protein n=1 Tax=Hevea brasiliensis TaxID=3981 RepID=A0A6A6KWU3_HEVBR|nr:hypothetical protein GH714_035164 [Hevea brasiliensis]
MEEAGGSCPKPTKRSIIARPGFGSSGHPIPLLSNHFKVSVNVTDVVFFPVSITAEDNRVVDEKRKIIDRLCQTYSCKLAGKSFAYDGEKTLYSLVRLPQSWMEFTVVPEESIAKRNETNNNTRDALRVLDTILKNRQSRCLPLRQTFFHDDPKNFTDVGGGIQELGDTIQLPYHSGWLAVRNYRCDDDSLLSASGVSIERQMMQVDSRVLETPTLRVGNKEDVFPRNGRWNFNYKTLFKTTCIDRWAVVNFSALLY